MPQPALHSLPADLSASIGTKPPPWLAPQGDLSSLPQTFVAFQLADDLTEIADLGRPKTSGQGLGVRINVGPQPGEIDINKQWDTPQAKTCSQIIRDGDRRDARFEVQSDPTIAIVDEVRGRH
jgi:hypothetical protein